MAIGYAPGPSLRSVVHDEHGRLPADSDPGRECPKFSAALNMRHFEGTEQLLEFPGPECAGDPPAYASK
ncbi:hypothetical protein A3Q37_02151 [Streptomyces sp. PTY087I2]|nr:hypothetical protein A3Q37_02151 [Streptomyces sp. PTY087I2]